MPPQTTAAPMAAAPSRRALFLGLVGAAALTLPAAPRRALAQAAPPGPFRLDPLPYAPGANEPHIDAQTMEIHHGRHHAAYVNAMNAVAREHPMVAERPIKDVLANLNAVPEAVRTTVRNNLGGHANHAMFWSIMGGPGGAPTGDLLAAVERDLGGVDRMRTDVNAAGARQFGSGWTFVTVTREGRLAVTNKPNQDTPLMDGQMVLLGNDVWEHAYYLKYQNRRADYLNAWWNVVDWDRVAERYAAARAGTLAL